MIIIAKFLIASGRILHLLLMIYSAILIARAILSWFPAPSLYAANQVFIRVTEPVLRPLRRLIPPRLTGGWDVSVFLAVILILFIDSFLVDSLVLYGEDILRQYRWHN